MKKKGQLSSFDIIVMVKELRNLLVNGFIDKVYQPNKSELIIKITVPTRSTDPDTGSKYQQLNLVIKLGKYLYIRYKTKGSEAVVQDPKKTPPGSYAMLLRKHLRNGKITDVYQHEFDRIMVMEINKKDTFQLLIELFGDGNVILVKDHTIIQPLFSQTWSARTLRAGEEYKYPPARINPRKIEFAEFIDVLSKSTKDLVRTLIMDLDIPGKFSEELCHRSGLDKNMKPGTLDDTARQRLFDNLQALFGSVDTEPVPVMYYETETMAEPFELMPVKLQVFEDFHQRIFDDYNSAVGQFFDPGAYAGASPGGPGNGISTSTSTGTTSSGSGEVLALDQQALETMAAAAQEADEERSRLQRQLEQQNLAIQKFNEEIKTNHEYGEAIYGNYQRCEELLNELKELRNSLEPAEILEHVTNKSDITQFNPHEGYVIVKMHSLANDEHIDIMLDLRKNTMENANNYYELSKHAKEKCRGAKKAMVSTQQALTALDEEESKRDKLEIPKAKPSLGKHFWFEKFHWLLSTKGNIIVAGRDAKSNDQVVKKYLKDKDRYCHADLTGAPSVVVKHNPDEDEITEESLIEACQFALIYSKAWNAKHGSGTAYWVKPDQVSKTPQSGEYLARGAFVIRGKRNHVTNIKLELCVGETVYQGRRKLLAGPIGPVKANVENAKYVILVPGMVKKNDMARVLSDMFHVSMDDVLSVLPSGDFELVESRGFKNDRSSD